MNLKEWEASAIELDRLEGNDEWKRDDSTGGVDEYNPELIRASLEALDTARTNCDTSTMVYLIRTALSRDLGGMGNKELYRHSYIGTKALVERYVDSAIRTIQAVVDMTVHSCLDPREMLEEMVYARQSFGRSALLLSGGATLGMSHIGVLKTLFEQDLLPRIISGASAGSIVCSVLCTRKDDEVPSLIKAFPFGDLGVFEGANEGVADHVRNLLTKGSWSDITHLTRVMRGWLGDVTFLEAYNRTRRICNICVSSASIYDVPRLLNYITAPNVLIWSAVAASCSVPLIFQGHPLLMKHPLTGEHEPWFPTPQQFIDGSVDNDLPMTRLAEMFNVNHFIVSQVNPHVVPFLAKDEQSFGARCRDSAKKNRSAFLDGLTELAKEEVLHRMHFLAEMGVFPNTLTKLLAVVSQTYSGDINILPEIQMTDLPLMLKNPTPSFMLRNCLIGERATWPKLSRIRDRVAIELALDQAVHTLRTRVVFSKSQVDLRRAMGAVKPMLSSTRHHRSRTGDSSSSSRGAQLSPSTITSGEITPSSEENRSIGRRRGSGASIQLVAARHKKPFFQDVDDDIGLSDEEDEGGRLELMVRSSRAAAAAAAAGRGGSGSGSGGKGKPRLRRNAKSHGHMRGGRPDVAYAARGDLLLWSERGEGSLVGDTVAVATNAREEEGVSVEGFSVEGLSPVGAVFAGSEASASDGVVSDADPYAVPAGHLGGSGKREAPSKLRYSES